MIIGLTGSIATGKSTVAKIMKNSGWLVFDADAAVHHLYSHSVSVKKKICRAFGKSALDSRGNVNRAWLAKYVFGVASKKKLLENIVHQEVVKLIQLKTRQARNRTIVLDIPLLFETGMDKLCDFTICVTSTQKLQIKRLQARNHMKRAEALRRIRAHWPQKMKIKKADIVIHNNGQIRRLRHAVKLVLLLLRAGNGT